MSPANRDQMRVTSAFEGHSTAVNVQNWIFTIKWIFDFSTLIHSKNQINFTLEPQVNAKQASYQMFDMVYFIICFLLF